LVIAITISAIIGVVSSSTPEHPIVIFHGFLGAELYCDGDNVESTPRLCKKKMSGYQLWGPATHLLGFNCLRHYTTSTFQDGKWVSRKGVKKYIKTYPHVDSVAKISKVDVFDTMLSDFKARGYVDNENLFAASYDWTQLPTDEWVQKTKELIEKASDHGKKKVLLIGHSMGCPYSYYFLKVVNDKDKEWVKKHIFKYVPIAPAWAGATVALKEMLNTEIINEMILPKLHGMLDKAIHIFHKDTKVIRMNGTLEDRDLAPRSVPDNSEVSMWVRHLPSAWVLLPWEEAFGKDSDFATVVSTSKKYTFGQMLSFIKSFSTDENKVDGMFKQSHNAFKDKINRYKWVPPIPVRICYGLGLKTPLRLEMVNEPEKQDFDDLNSVWKGVKDQTTISGDGTVPVQSLGYAASVWQDEGDVQTKIVSGDLVEHKEILKNREIIDYILAQLEDPSLFDKHEHPWWLHIVTLFVGLIVGIIGTVICAVIIVECCD